MALHKYIDFHTHFDGSYSSDVEAIPTFRLGVEDVPPYLPKIWAGVHPWDSSADIDFAESIKSFENQIVGIGEIGLDYYFDSSNVEQQQSLFVEQLSYAESHSLPVTIHCVRAYNDLLNTLRDRAVRVPVTIHSFGGNLIMAQDFLELCCYFSFGAGGFASRKSLELIKSLPLERIFLETDDSKVDIRGLYQQLAIVREQPLESIIEQLESNFSNIVK